MLVLSRKVGETIQIGSNITITVLEIQGTRMKIGISAPLDQRVMRGELVQWQDAPTKAAPIADSSRRVNTTSWVELPTGANAGLLAAAR